eukprot:2514424-Rhodomonas_salina.2
MIGEQQIEKPFAPSLTSLLSHCFELRNGTDQGTHGRYGRYLRLLPPYRRCAGISLLPAARWTHAARIQSGLELKGKEESSSCGWLGAVVAGGNRSAVRALAH